MFEQLRQLYEQLLPIFIRDAVRQAGPGGVEGSQRELHLGLVTEANNSHLSTPREIIPYNRVVSL